MLAELEVLNRLLNWADEWDNVRAVTLTGSRATPQREPDPLSDYDVNVFVRELDQVRRERWLEPFGEVIVRWPLGPQPTFDPRWITQLAVFENDTRIDFQFTAVDNLIAECPADFLCVLIDKDEISRQVRPLPVEGATNSAPNEREFLDRINAFWWDLPYAAKALRRDELDYARFVLESDLRFNKLVPLLRWYVGSTEGWDADVGTHGRWLRRYLDDEVRDAYEATYSGSEPGEMWRAIGAMQALVRRVGQDVAREMGFRYPVHTDRKASGYIERIAEVRLQ